MSEVDSELAGRLITGHKKDGRCVYDAAVKREVVQACMKPGVSVAGVAMMIGVNANLLHAWISKSRRRGTTRQVEPIRADVDGVFTPVQIESPGQRRAREREATVASVVIGTAAVTLHVRLPNGVEFDIGDARLDDLASVVQVLGGMSCSASTSR
jgi:transposase